MPRRYHRRPSGAQRGITLVELLVALSIMGILTTLILATWFGLQDSYSLTTVSDHQREAARDAMSRIVRELRDAAPYSPEGLEATYPAIRYARGSEVRFYTTFNDADNYNPDAEPTYTRFDLRPNPDEASDGMCLYLEKDYSGGVLSEEFEADESRILVKNLNNVLGSTDESTAVFTYWFVSADLATGDVTTDHRPNPVTTDNITTIGITLQVDLNPGHSPQAYELHSTVHPRNLRRT